MNYLSQLQLINRCRLQNFDVLSQKRHTREAGAIRVAKIGAAYAKDMIRAHLGALIVDKNDLLVEWFASKYILMVILLSSDPIAPLYT